MNTDICISYKFQESWNSPLLWVYFQPFRNVKTILSSEDILSVLVQGPQFTDSGVTLVNISNDSLHTCEYVKPLQDTPLATIRIRTQKMVLKFTGGKFKILQ